MTDQPLDLDAIEAFLDGPHGKGALIDSKTARRLVAEVRRLRAELAAARGQAVADDTIWLERRPCGCVVAAVAAIVPGAWTLTTAEDVALHFHPTEGERRRAAEAGLTVEPVTGAQYREEFRDRWHCARHTAPAVRSTAV